MAQKKLLIVDPFSMADELSLPLSLPGWELERVPNLTAGLQEAKSREFLVGLALLERLDEVTRQQLAEALAAGSSMEWVALLSPGCLKSGQACKFIAENFFDYHTLPVDRSRLQIILGHAFGKAQLKNRIAPVRSTPGEFGMVGHSSGMQALLRQMQKVAGVDAPVLIGGESGTGKELVARAIHELSKPADAPFVAVNCGAIPGNLIQSELFGHEKGAFTGAHQRKIGHIEMASGGTIFLDEIGDLSLDLQVNLLRFLQERTIDRLGGSRPIRVEARVLAATHIDLERAVEQGRFREDLYYRLNVMPLRVPPLRERGGDIGMLAVHFHQRFVPENRKVKGFSQAAMKALYAHSWPGNVRELLNRVRRAVVMCEGGLIQPADLGLERRAPGREVMTLESIRAAAERDAVTRCLKSNRYNLSEAARQLGVSRVTLYRLLDKLNIVYTKDGAINKAQPLREAG